MIGQLFTSPGQLEVQVPAVMPRPVPEAQLVIARGQCYPFGATAKEA